MASHTEGSDHEEILKTEESPCKETRLYNEKGDENEQIEPHVVEIQKNDGVPVEDKIEVDKEAAEEQSSMEKIQQKVQERQQVNRDDSSEAKEPKVEVKNIEDLEAVEKLESEVTEEVEILYTEVVKPDPKVPKVEGKLEASPENEIKDNKVDENFKEKTCKGEEPTASIISEQVVSNTLEVEAARKEDTEKFSLPDVSENVEGLPKGTMFRLEAAEGGNSEGSTTLVTMEHDKNEKSAKDETNKYRHAEKKVDEASVTANESQKSEEEVKEGKSLDTKSSQDLPKEVLPAKSTQKQSKKLMSKMKQSLVKAKKAIIGKSPSSKAIPSETQGEIEVK